MYVNIFVVPYREYRTIVEKSMDRRVRIKEEGQEGRITITSRCHREPTFIASDFSSRVQSQDISKFGMQKQAYRAAH
jgi:hypothetical protein